MPSKLSYQPTICLQRLTGSLQVPSIPFKTRDNVALAGLSQLSARWRVSILFNLESCSNFLNSSALIVTLTPTAVPVAGRTTACTTFKTMVASILSPTILIELQMACAGLTGEAPSKSPLSLTSRATVNHSLWQRSLNNQYP